MCCEGAPTMIIPDEKYLIYYPYETPEEKDSTRRNGCLRVGAHIIIKRTIV